MSERRCEIRTASDGTRVRVNGEIDQQTLDALTAKVREWADNRCDNTDGPEMISIAQRIHGRKNHRCGRRSGHDGPHRWPDHDGGVEWTAPA